MHQPWQDLIVFYITGTLPPADAAAFERHLARCAACRAALEEWRLVAGVVYTEADTWARTVPPLSPTVRVQAAALPKQSTNGHRPGTTTTAPDLGQTIVSRRYRRPIPSGGRLTLPLTLAAAVTVVALVGALLLVLANRDDTHTAPGSAANSLSPPATLGAAVSTAPPAIAQVPTSTQWDLGILAPPGPSSTPASTPTPQVLPPMPVIPGGTPTMPGMGGGGGPLAPMMETCTVHSATGGPVPAYRWPGRDYDIVGALGPDEYRPVIVSSGDGWYQIVAAGGGLAGWVPASEITLSGACDGLGTPTPTPASPEPPAGCVAAPRVTDGMVAVFEGPGRQYNSLTTLSQPAMVTARTETGWFQVSMSASLAGWVDGQEINIYGFCADLPVMALQTGSLPTP